MCILPPTPPHTACLQVAFAPKACGGVLSHAAFTDGKLTMLPAEGQSALRLMAEVPQCVIAEKAGLAGATAGSAGAPVQYHAEVSIETAFWDPIVQKAKCLRCTSLLDACSCKYANDLLLPVKKNECKLIAQKATSANGGAASVGVMLRIPRTRQRPTKLEAAMGITKANDWLRKLPNCGHGVSFASQHFCREWRENVSVEKNNPKEKRGFSSPPTHNSFFFWGVCVREGLIERIQLLK